MEITKVKDSEQIEQVAGLAEEIWTEHYLPIIGAEQLEYMLDNYQSAAAIERQIAGGLEYYIIMHGGVAVGYIAVEDNEGLFISKYYMHKDSRGKGIGRAAMEWLEQTARKRSHPRIWLKCNRTNSTSLAVYDKLGFSIIAEEDGDLGNGYVATDYVLEKKL